MAAVKVLISVPFGPMTAAELVLIVKLTPFKISCLQSIHVDFLISKVATIHSPL